MRLMIVGQLEGYISQAGKIALQRGAKVIHCEDTEQAIGTLLNGKGADLAMVDIKQPIGSFIQKLDEEHIHMPVIACGIGTDARAAVKAIQDGAKEYVPLPPDSDLIAAILEAVAEENNTMIANDPAMKDVLKIADRVAPSDATILITGESGTGKEVMARYVHNKSKRSDGSFIAVNCAAIPENLLESELFGHEKGAFTGASNRRIGKFEEAHGGTLLLDEISEMHPLLQAKLLRAIQEREITRVGSNAPVKVDTRLVATSNRNLEESVKKGEFREDLYFRLNVVNVSLPALRERPSDIVPLGQFFADKYSEQNGLPSKKLSKEAIAKLQSHGWRGNIRELENTMHRAVLISMEDEIEDSAIQVQSFSGSAAGGPAATNAPDPSGVSSAGQPANNAPAQQSASASSGDDLGTNIVNSAPSTQNPGAVENLVGKTIAEVERDMIIDTLEHCLGNRTHAANILGISIRTLRNKLNQYKDEGMDVPAASSGTKGS